MNKTKKMLNEHRKAVVAAVIIICVIILVLCLVPKKKKTARKDNRIDIRNICDVYLEKSSYVYTGKPIKPKVSLVFGDLETGISTVKSKYYTVTYKNNVKPGMATVTVTSHGKSIKGSHTRMFFITRKKMTSKIMEPLYTTAGTRDFYGSKPIMVAAKQMIEYCDSKNLTEKQIKKDLYAWRRTITKAQFMEFYRAWAGLLVGMDDMYEEAETSNFEGYKAQFTAMHCYKEVKSHMTKRGKKNWKTVKT